MFQQSASMKGTVKRAALGAALSMAIVSAAAGCGGDKTAAGSTEASAAAATATAPTASAIVTSPAGSASADQAESDDAPIAGAKTFDCGAKGQKPCPMQKWMKTVMAGASSSGDGKRLAEALTYVANHAPPGYATWTALSNDGAKKAKADDIDGAKVSCKQCHDLYKKKYKSTLRDLPF